MPNLSNSKASGMIHFKRASCLNRHGAYLLSIGEGMHAFAYFKFALQIMTNSSEREEQPKSIVPLANGENNPCLVSFESVEAINAVDMNHSQGISAPVKQKSEKSQTFIFSRAFVFDPNASTILDHPFCCALVVFNMALSLHLTDNCMSSMVRMKVLHLYDLARNLLGESSNVSECLIVSSAALNNSAQIYHEFSEFKLCQQMLEELVCVLSSTACATSVEDRDIESFLLNALLLRNPTVARAA